MEYTKELYERMREQTQWHKAFPTQQNEGAEVKCLLDEIDRLQSLTQCEKQPYQIKYKFMPNDRDIDDMKALTVWGTSPLAACQALVDANDWRGQDMEFVVNDHGIHVLITSKGLE